MSETPLSQNIYNHEYLHTIKENGLFPDFEDWQVGYGAFTYSIEAKKNLIEYVKNQEEHHRVKTYREELMELLREHKIKFDEKYLE